MTQPRLRLPQLLARAQRLTSRRALLAIVGPPGSGKSTVAEQVVRHLGDRAVSVPMDGFHLSNAELARLGRADRKGAIDTFDGDGYLHLLRRLAPGDRDVYAPTFDRRLEEPVAASVLVAASTPLVVCEGNYLLTECEPWRSMQALFAESWYCELGDSERLRRLIARHHAFGRTLEEAERWARGPDEANALLIAETARRADVIADVG
jgi:pantothenate kinase